MIDDALMGFAEVDITPAYNVQTIGFNREDNLSRGVLHSLLAQVSIWQSGTGKCCLVAIDHIGFTSQNANLLRDRIAKKLCIGQENVMLCFSHTHSAPNTSLEPAYFHFLCEQVLQGVSKAERSLTPVTAAWGVATADIGVNRRNLQGVLDRRIGMLKVVDAATGRLRLLILRVAAHANVLQRDNYLISSDFIGITRRLLEEKYDCKVMITQGASGNVKPKYGGSLEALEALDKMAAGIAAAISTWVDKLTPRGIDRLTMFSGIAPCFADVPPMDQARSIAEEALRESRISGDKWLEEVARLHREGVKQQGAHIEVQYFVLNDGCLCGVADEVMCELAVDVTGSCNDSHIHFGGYTNGCDGYLPTAEEYDRGGYELHSYLLYYHYHGRVMPLNRDTAERLVRMVSEQWNELK